MFSAMLKSEREEASGTRILSKNEAFNNDPSITEKVKL